MLYSPPCISSIIVYPMKYVYSLVVLLVAILSAFIDSHDVITHIFHVLLHWQLDNHGCPSANQVTPKNMDEINGLVQERHNSSALAMELCLSYANPSKCTIT